MKVNKLLEYMQSYMTRPFYMQFVWNLPIMQCFKDLIESHFVLLFYFKGPKSSNYARYPCQNCSYLSANDLSNSSGKFKQDLMTFTTIFP